MTNVVRFPVERCRRPPRLGDLQWIRPLPDFIQNIARDFGLEPPDPHIRRRAEAAMAWRIANEIPFALRIVHVRRCLTLP
jgi:hypothetical protein